MRRLRESTPDLAVNLFDMTAAQQSRALAANKLDAGFIGFAFEADSAHLQKRCIGQTRFVLALPEGHPFAKRRRIDLRQFEREVFLIISDEHFPGASRIISAGCAEAGFRPRTLQTPERGHTILGLVAAGCGVALLPETLSALPHPGVVFRPTAHTIAAELFLAWRAEIDPLVLRSLLRAAAL